MVFQSMQMILNVSDFSKNPGLGLSEYGPDSGEDFYPLLKEAFIKALNEKSELVVNLDGVWGYSPSFLKQVFGSLSKEFSEEDIREILKIYSQEEPHWIDYIKEILYKI